MRFSINEKGELAGESFSDGNGFKVMQATGFNSRSCKFKPYLVNDKPSYYYIDFTFAAP